MLNSKVGIYLSLLLVATLLTVSSASIENKPVKVTHQNSGPRYHIDEVERTKLTLEHEDGQPQIGRLPFSPMRPPPMGAQNEPQEGADSEHPTVGRVNIRRIFLIPMSQPSQDNDNSPASSSIWSSGSSAQSKPPSESDADSLYGRVLWPFLAPSRHLFGTDQASRSPPTADESFERPSMADRSHGLEATANREREDLEPRQRPSLEIPFQMMIDMMQQALSQAVNAPNGLFSDLNKEASSDKASSDNKPESSETGSEANEVPRRPNTELETAPKQPVSNNSTKEEIVEIEGKKYLKKTVVNRHVGENIIFMTKRLLFVPLNETSEVPAQPEQPSTTTVKAPVNTEKVETDATPVEQAVPSSTTSSSKEEPRKVEEATTTLASSTPAEVSSSTTTTTTESPSTTSTSTTTVNTNVEETTPKDKTNDGFEIVPERIVESKAQSDSSSN